MEVVRNIKSMTANQFCSLQAFEFVYLTILAVCPFVVALREITYIILAITAVVVIVVIFKQYTKSLVDADGRVVLITGCDSGIGNACARRLYSFGFTVVAACYNDTSEGALRLKEGANGRLHVTKLDITDEESVNRCVRKIKGLINDKGLWTLINNAGVSTFGDVEFSPLDSYQNVIDVNMLGTLRMTKAFLPLIRAAKGRVITITGATGQLSLPGQSAFCMSNFGLEAFTDALRLEVQPFGVKVITIRPGNFAGATRMLNRSGLENLQQKLVEMKEKTDPEVLSAYGHNYLDNRYQQLFELSKSTANSLLGVTDAIEDATCTGNPKSYYLVNGGSQLLDLGNVLIRLRPFLPSVMFDFLVSRYYGTQP